MPAFLKHTGIHAVYLLVAALIVCLPEPTRAGVLYVTSPEGTVVRTPMTEGRETCLNWAHSVTGGLVVDCFENRGGQLVLTRSFLHDFSAGLGVHPERGKLVSAPGGGYWIEGLDMAIHDNRIVLRTGGPAVGHRLVLDDGAGVILPQRTRLMLTLIPQE